MSPRESQWLRLGFLAERVWNSYRLAEITPAIVWDTLCVVRDYRKSLPSLVCKNPYTGSAYKFHAHLCTFFEWVVRTGLLDRSPMDGIHLPPRSERLKYYRNVRNRWRAATKNGRV